MASLDEQYRGQRDRLAAAGQAHLLGFWSELSDSQRRELLADLEQIDLARCTPLIEPMVLGRPTLSTPESIEPPRALPSAPTPELAELYARALQMGEGAIRDGRVAAFTVAGGQGTRLGYPGPKGGFRISPVRNAPLFQLFAEYLLGIERRFGRRPHWYVMTSPSNHESTRTLFEESGWYGLRGSDVTFFQQGQMPAFQNDGRIAMEQKHRIALSPDGHGGSLAALRSSGCLADMKARGVEIISYFQVDNPLVHVIDPLFIGLHAARQSEMSSKAVSKADDLERVGNFCEVDGKLAVIEYSDLPESLARRKGAGGQRLFDAGSIAIHLLDRAFVERISTPGATVQLPWHRAEKRVEIVGDDGGTVRPSAPNVVKLELFVFDAIPLARNPLLLMTRREEEFSPVKNAEGADSPATSRRDQSRRAAKWLEQRGVRIARGADGEPAGPIEISPRYAFSSADLEGRLPSDLKIDAGRPLLLE